MLTSNTVDSNTVDGNTANADSSAMTLLASVPLKLDVVETQCH